MANDFQKQTSEQLHKAVADMREKLRSFRFGGAGSRTRNVREGRELRKDVARALTELSAREIAQSEKKA